MQFTAEIDVRICGIPARARGTVTSVKGSHSYNAPSDVDYYGYTEVEDVEILDRKGYKAAWLERKMTKKDWSYVETALCEEEPPEPDYPEYDD